MLLTSAIAPASVERMAVKERPRTELSVAALHEQLGTSIRADDKAQLNSDLRAVGEAVEQAIATDVAQIALQRDRLDRVRRRLTEDATHPLSQHALGYLQGVDDELDRARTRLLGEIAERHRSEEADVLRARIAGALDRARRPRDLAEQLGVDVSQVSRELRQLVSAGRVERVEPPADASEDRRAHWYARVPPRPARVHSI